LTLVLGINTGRQIIRTSDKENLEEIFYDEKIKDISQIEAMP